ncbi:MAG: hypothetical protein II412_06200 [Clostridia bacterium]|jgi:hypothetical protein|nr:hypothetical protein [Clostridia bacterium]
MPEQNDMHEVLERLARIETKLDALDDHEKRLRDLEGKSGKKWDSVTISVITSIVVGVVGFIIGKLF